MDTIVLCISRVIQKYIIKTLNKTSSVLIPNLLKIIFFLDIRKVYSFILYLITHLN